MTDANHLTPDDFALVNDLFDGRLDDAEAEQVRVRIASEPGLQELWDDLRRVQTGVREHGPQGADLEPPADFPERVRDRIAAEEARTALATPATSPATRIDAPRRPGRMLRLMTVATAAAAVLVIGISVHLALRKQQDAAETTHESADVPRVTSESARQAVDELKTRDDEAGDGVPRMRPGGKSEAAPPAQPAAPAGAVQPEDTPPPVRAPQPGAFRRPGGAVPPGLREPADSAPPPPPPAAEPPAPAEAPAPVEAPAPDTGVGAGGSGAGRVGGFAGRRADGREQPPAVDRAAREVVLVFEAGDLTAARRELDGLLLSLRSADEVPKSAARGAPKAPPLPGTPSAPASPRPTTPPPADGPAKAPAAEVEEESLKRPVRERLFRLGVAASTADVKRLAERYVRERKSKADAGESAADASRPAQLGSVTWQLNAAAWKRLDTLVGDATWEADKLPAAQEKGRPEKDEGTPDAFDEEEDAEGLEARSKKKGETRGAKSRAGKRALPEKESNLPVRVRILIVKRK